MKKLLTIKIIAVFVTFLLSFLAHYMYSLFPNLLISIFFPVNESIWEHMKIIFSSTILYGIFEKYLLKWLNIPVNNYNFQLFFISFIGIIFYLAIYLPIYNIFGENLFLSITLLFITYIFIQYISYRLYIRKNLEKINNISIYLILFSYICFFYLTYSPPHIPLFYDSVTDSYSVENEIININS